MAGVWVGIVSAPNRFIRDFVTEKYVPMIATYLLDIVAPASAQVSVTVVGGVVHRHPLKRFQAPPQRRLQWLLTGALTLAYATRPVVKKPSPAASVSPSNLVEGYTFERFVEGKSNQLALAAAQQVSEHPGDSYNPLCFCMAVSGLGRLT